MTLRFRKKPVVIEAFQMTRERHYDNGDWPQWLNEAWQKQEGESGAFFRNETVLLCIWTLDGVHLVLCDDWIIRGVQGELYPCKPSIFDATYEPA